MTTREMRDTIQAMLAAYLGVPVILDDQYAPEPEPPFVRYKVTVPYTSMEMGNYRVEPGESEGEAIVVRETQAEASYSFTACSFDRPGVYGDDEAHDLAEKAQGWFEHVGRAALSALGIVVIQVQNAGDRTMLSVVEVMRQYGFDVQFRFPRVEQYDAGAMAKQTTVLSTMKE